jgi:hypothetical protein
MTRKELEILYLTMLMQADAAAWGRRIALGESAAPDAPLNDDERRFMRQLRRVTTVKREEA